MGENNQKINRTWDWRTMISGVLFQYLWMDNFPGWDRLDEDNPDSYPRVVLSTVCGRDLAVEFDYICKGMFHYADLLIVGNEGSPFVRDGDRYVSRFHFQFKSDAELFHDRFGGVASWEPDYESRTSELIRSGNDPPIMMQAQLEIKPHYKEGRE
jgi:hypothetical protein